MCVCVCVCMKRTVSLEGRLDGECRAAAHSQGALYSSLVAEANEAHRLGVLRYSACVNHYKTQSFCAEMGNGGAMSRFWSIRVKELT